MLLTGLVSSRICHDLISPIGAIGNGLELLHLSAGPGASAASTEEMALIATCAETASASLQFMRLAFGTRPPDDPVSVQEVARITAPYFVRRKVVFDWGDTEDRVLPYRSVQTLLMMALCVVGILPRGGDARLIPEGEQACLGWQISNGTLHVTERFRALLTKAPELKHLAPAEVHHAILWQLLASVGQVPQWREAEAMIAAAPR